MVPKIGVHCSSFNRITTLQISEIFYSSHTRLCTDDLVVAADSLTAEVGKSAIIVGITRVLVPGTLIKNSPEFFGARGTDVLVLPQLLRRTSLLHISPPCIVILQCWLAVKR